MKNKLIVNLILLLFMAAGCAHTSDKASKAAKPDTALSSAVATGAPAVVVPEPVFDFGEVKEGTDYTHEFLIMNKGAATLEIKKVQPG